MNRIKYKFPLLIGIFLVVQISAQLFFSNVSVSAQTFDCPRDPDYPAAGTYQLPSGLSSECENIGYYVFAGNATSPTIEYHTKSSSGTDTIKATLALQDASADPLVWRGTASYDGHMIEIGIPRSGFQGGASGSQAIRTDNPGTPGATSTGIRIATNDTATAFAQSQNIQIESGPGNPDANCKTAPGEALNKQNCGIIHYIVLLTQTLSAVVGIVVVIMIAVGGIQYASSRDDPAQVKVAKDRIQNAVLALLFYLFALAFLQWLVPGGVFQ